MNTRLQHAACCRTATHVFRFVVFAVVVLFSSVCTAQVREARGFDIKESGVMGRPGSVVPDVYWLDNERVIFIGAKQGDYVEQSPGVRFPAYHLYVWDTRTGAVRRHHEGSTHSALCVYRGYVHFELDKNGSRYTLAGPTGKETLRQLDKAAMDERNKYERVMNRMTCREYKRSKLPALGYRVDPLLEGDFLSLDREPQGAEVIHYKYWPRSKQPVVLDMSRGVVGIDGYSHYRDSYVLQDFQSTTVFGENIVRRAWLMDRSGRAQEFTPPAGPWMRGSTFVAPTKPGLFLLSHAMYGGGNGAAGGYLMKGTDLHRVIAGLPTRFDVSPDGCKVALAISEISPDKPHTPWVKAVDLCSKEL